jgi:Uncharacterized conserved protein
MSKKPYIPPYNITNAIVNLIAKISEQVVSIASTNEVSISPHLRKNNQIRTIHSSLAIENNSLSLEQVADVINGAYVLGTPNEIKEVQNAYEAYNLLSSLDPLSINDLLKAHKTMMLGLTKEIGILRSGGVGIFAGENLVHMAPPATRIPQLIDALFDWLKNSDVHPLIKSCVFHYEFEFIHPFADGNGRIGRLWQTLILSHWKSLFSWLPIETLIYKKQDEYYQSLAAADKAADSTVFIEFMLCVINDTLDKFIKSDQVTAQVTVQVKRLMDILGNETLSAKKILDKLNLKHRPTLSNNYLHPALKLGLIEMTLPDKPNSSKQKYRAIKFLTE